MSSEEASCTELGFGLHTKCSMYDWGYEMMPAIMIVLGTFLVQALLLLRLSNLGRCLKYSNARCRIITQAACQVTRRSLAKIGEANWFLAARTSDRSWSKLFSKGSESI